jgi:putative transposase
VRIRLGALSVRLSDSACSKLRSSAYLVARRALSLVVPIVRSSRSEDIEILVLRHELEILRRNQARPQLKHSDRAWLDALSRLLARERWSAFCVRPDTLLPGTVAWPPGIGRILTVGPGRPRITDELITLIVEMATDNPFWGYGASRASC